MPHDDRLIRERLRAPGFDYTSPGRYFVTIWTHYMECRSGVVDGGVVRLNDAGDLVASAWRAISDRDDHLRLAGFVVMPNHLHAIVETLEINESNAVSLSAIVGAFKTLTTNAYADRVRSGTLPRCARCGNADFTITSFGMSDRSSDTASTSSATLGGGTRRTVGNDPDRGGWPRLAGTRPATTR